MNLMQDEQREAIRLAECEAESIRLWAEGKARGIEAKDDRSVEESCYQRIDCTRV